MALAFSQGAKPACYPQKVQIEGNLVIRWQEPDAFDVRFVPAHPADGSPVESLRVRDPAALERLLHRVGLPQERIIDVLRSPYVLHSLRIRVDPRAARRAGLLETPLRRLIGRLTRFLRHDRHAS
jgi:hypothetical protein